ncbi:hypothetical protein LTR78_002222 [Recurvomyces mirabilis]|uniref:Heterokaryon incompatibility domain-containing protein n=1 Tax=Recurvomyces mirabilis TaxID=574656 RepID=A0AAE0WUL4_9PEZI|nr:hypothetical protein LTR78_002222 [Recurvomyces mirabilis]
MAQMGTLTCGATCPVLAYLSDERTLREHQQISLQSFRRKASEPAVIKLSDYSPAVTPKKTHRFCNAENMSSEAGPGPFSRTPPDLDASSMYSLRSVFPRPTTRLHDDEVGGTTERLLRPRYLCMLDDSTETGFRVVSANDDIELLSVQYIFVSYTRRHFYTQMAGDTSLSDIERERRRASAERDAAALIKISIDAAKSANTTAFWIDFECVQPDSPEHADASRSMQDVYRICDVVRAARSMVIVVGPPINEQFEHVESDFSSSAQLSWLRQWGDRLWTLPEALLCPRDHGVMLWYAGANQHKTQVVEKRNLPPYVWDDAATVGQLIDHYEGSIQLTQLELLVIALNSLQRRQTVARMHADAIYALMGLMRERVLVRKDDSAFQAFARLSLANDSDRPLERLYCLKPPTHTASWHTLQDAWGAKLWDITPECQISEVCDDDAVILGNLYGAHIDWAPLSSIDFIFDTSRSNVRLWRFCHGVACAVPAFFMLTQAIATLDLIIWQIITSAGPPMDSTDTLGLLLTFQWGFIAGILLLCYVTSILIPPLIITFYNGDVEQTQARLCGFQGMPDLPSVERTLFGRCRGRLEWSSHSLSEAAEDGIELYTIVDTVTMKAHVFRARTRPDVLMVCGRQGGLLRTLLCSYDIEECRFHREAVLRMETKILQRMSRMDLCRVSLTPRERYADEIVV